MVEWLAKLLCDQEVLGSIPAATKLFSIEPAILKFIWGQNNQRRMVEKSELSYSITILGLNTHSLRTKAIISRCLSECWF